MKAEKKGVDAREMMQDEKVKKILDQVSFDIINNIMRDDEVERDSEESSLKDQKIYSSNGKNNAATLAEKFQAIS